MGNEPKIVTTLNETATWLNGEISAYTEKAANGIYGDVQSQDRTEYAQTSRKGCSEANHFAHSLFREIVAEGPESKARLLLAAQLGLVMVPNGTSYWPMKPKDITIQDIERIGAPANIGTPSFNIKALDLALAKIAKDRRRDGGKG